MIWLRTNWRALDLHAGLEDLVLQGHATLALFEQVGLRLEGLLDFLAARVAVAGRAGLAAIGLDIALQGLDALVGAA